MCRVEGDTAAALETFFGYHYYFLLVAARPKYNLLATAPDIIARALHANAFNVDLKSVMQLPEFA